MAQSVRTRVQHIPKQEQEVHVITNPSDQRESRLNRLHRFRSSKCQSVTKSSSHRSRHAAPDYEAPLTSETLLPNSRWLIVRRNLHRIRFMGYNQQGPNSNLTDLYIILQRKKELRRAQSEIKNMDKETNFHAVKHFALAVDNKHTKMYDTSHVKRDDAIIYDGLGEEPLALQNLLYYFSQQDVPHGTLFWDFLNEVNCVLNMKRKRTVRVERLRKLALTLAIIFYSIIGFMLCLLIISFISTATKMDDPEVKWMEPTVDKYTKKLL
jgi:hypothetical protein